MISKTNLEQSHVLLWYQELKYHPHWKHYSFKKLNCEYPKFKSPVGLITEVEEDQFIKQEEFVLPFFIGSQFGVFPKVEIFADLKAPILLARLDKSLLSGCVAGLSIGIWHKREFKEIEFFKN